MMISSLLTVAVFSTRAINVAAKSNKLLSIFIKNIEEFNKENIDELFKKKGVRFILNLKLSKIAYIELYRNLDL